MRNHQIAGDDAFAEELALDSPALFQRWLAHLVAEALVEKNESRGVFVLSAPAPVQNIAAPCPTPKRTTIFPLPKE